STGTPLGATQLNASANVEGTFVYTPPSGTVLGVGAGQTLSVAFTPTSTGNFNTASATTPITVTATIITNPAAGNITQSSAGITWTTSAAAKSRIDYGATTAYGASVADAALVTGHSLALTFLSPSTTYHYRITSQAGGGSPASTGDLSFLTSAAPPAPAQLITPGPGSNLVSGSQLFTWDPGTGVSSYKVDVGTAVGGRNVYAGIAGTALSAQVIGLPTNGALLWVRLQSMIGGVWQSADYPLKAFT